jgi:hypothetical protein
MRLTRWKLLAGVLGLAMGGVAATADPPARVITTCAPRVCYEPCPPIVVSVPVVPSQGVVVAAHQPPLPVVVPEPAVLVLPAAAEKPAAEKAPPPRPVVENVELPAPVAPIVHVPTPGTPPPGYRRPVMVSGPATTLDLPPPVQPVVAPTNPPEPTLVTPVVDETIPLPPISSSPQRLDPPALPPSPSKPITPTAEPTRAGASLRVVLHIGAGQPKFEVMTGDDTLLKVVSDKVDVRSPSEKGETMSALKAAGGVRFSAPGCEGTCSELTVLPGTGDVELAGDVRVKCKQGKGETEIVGGKLTFKLGSAPAYSVPEPTGTVSTSFQK